MKEMNTSNILLPLLIDFKAEREKQTADSFPLGFEEQTFSFPVTAPVPIKYLPFYHTSLGSKGPQWFSMISIS
jgi:hypothetical protein